MGQNPTHKTPFWLLSQPHKPAPQPTPTPLPVTGKARTEIYRPKRAKVSTTAHIAARPSANSASQNHASKIPQYGQTAGVVCRALADDSDGHLPAQGHKGPPPAPYNRTTPLGKRVSVPKATGKAPTPLPTDERDTKRGETENTTADAS